MVAPNLHQRLRIEEARQHLLLVGAPIADGFGPSSAPRASSSSRPNRGRNQGEFIRDRINEHSSRIFKTPLSGEHMVILCGAGG
ncbi:hypothetical protein NL676_028712 [Syzygium grande]|nr:hypothetical protein NL676_028712 [Syzygium grande]